MTKLKHSTVSLTEGPVTRGIILFALPMLLSNLFQQLYNSIDSAVVGQFAGDIALAAVGSTAALINLLIGFFLGIATGTGVLYAMHYGAGDYPGLKKICDAAYILSLAAAAFISAVGIIFAPNLLRLMDMPDDVLPQAVVYLRIFLIGTAPNLIYNVGAGMIRARGDSARPLVYLMISGILNLVLDLTFVAGLKLGAAGAALATIMAQTLSAVLVVRYMMRLPEDCRFRPTKMKLDKVAVTDVIRISVPCGLQGSMFNISNLLVQAKINSFGTVAMAGVAAYSKIDGFIYMPLSALSLAVSTYVGQNIGAGHYERVKKGVRVCLVLAVAVMITTASTIILCFEPVIQIFTREREAMDFARSMMLHLAPFVWIFAFSDILGGAMRGAGAAVPVTIISAVCICVFRILWLFVMLRLINGITTVFWCYPLSWTLSSAVMALYYFRCSAMRAAIKATVKA